MKRYNRADLGATLYAAQYVTANNGKVRYVYATAYGFTIATSKPPANQKYIIVNAGRVEKPAEAKARGQEMIP